MKLSERISALCDARGVSLFAMEKACGLKSTVARWDAHAPALDKVQAVAQFFGVTVSELIGEKEKAPGTEPEAEELIKDYAALGDRDRRVVRAVVRELSAASEEAAPAPETKIIPLLGQRFAAGRGEPEYGQLWEDYSVPAESRADFAVRISGNSMEPTLPDGSIALCRKGAPADGDVAVLIVDGGFLVKQICEDSFGNLYLFSLNRARSDADDVIYRDSGRTVLCLGTVILDKRPPLPKL